MNPVLSAIKDTVPISQFNRGLAGHIFEEVKRTGAKVVMKNNSAECVLLSPEEYAEIMDALNDARLLSLAVERMSEADPSTFISEEEVKSSLGITDDDLADADEVEIE